MSFSDDFPGTVMVSEQEILDQVADYSDYASQKGLDARITFSDYPDFTLEYWQDHGEAERLVHVARSLGAVQEFAAALEMADDASEVIENFWQDRQDAEAARFERLYMRSVRMAAAESKEDLVARRVYESTPYKYEGALTA